MKKKKIKILHCEPYSFDTNTPFGASAAGSNR